MTVGARSSQCAETTSSARGGAGSASEGTSARNHCAAREFLSISATKSERSRASMAKHGPPPCEMKSVGSAAAPAPAPAAAEEEDVAIRSSVVARTAAQRRGALRRTRARNSFLQERTVPSPTYL